MANYWTRLKTPSMQLNKSPISSTVGYQLVQQIQTPNMSLPNSEATCPTARTSWRRYRRHFHVTHNGSFSIQPCNHSNSKSPREQFEHFITSTDTSFRPIQLVGLPLHCQSLACTTHATHIGSKRKWLKELPLSDPKRKVLTDNIAKTETWWSNQPSEAIETVERVAVMMGIPASLLGKNYDALSLLRAMTAAISLTN